MADITITEEDRIKVMAAIEQAKKNNPVLREIMDLMNQSYNDAINDVINILNKHRTPPIEDLIWHISKLKQ